MTASLPREPRCWRLPGGAIPESPPFAAVRSAQGGPTALGLRSQSASRNRRGKEHRPRGGAAEEGIARTPERRAPAPRRPHFVRSREQVPFCGAGRRSCQRAPARGRSPKVSDHDACRSPAAGSGLRISGHAGKDALPPGSGFNQRGPTRQDGASVERTRILLARATRDGPVSVVGIDDLDPVGAHAEWGTATGGRSNAGLAAPG